jgi:hypothetical protein
VCQLQIRSPLGDPGLCRTTPHYHVAGRAGLPYLPAYEPVTDKSVDYRAFRLQTTTKGIIEIFAQ